MNARSVAVLAALALAPGVASAQAADTWRVQAVASFDEVWQTVADTFYDPSCAGLQWPDVRQELRPRVEAAASADDARGVIREMLARLRRSHFVLLSESRSPRRHAGRTRRVPWKAATSSSSGTCTPAAWPR